MESETAPSESGIQVKESKTSETAPAIQAEPASGAAAEMSGALASEQQNKVATTTLNEEPSKTNGSAENTSQAHQPDNTADTTESKPKSSSPAGDDTEMQDATETTQIESGPTEDAPPATNGTPATKGTNGRRKSSGGVPEHKSKKLNKKKSLPKITHIDAKLGDYFFARLKSYPPWPSIICDEEMLPQSLINTRPVTTKKEDGTYNEAYEDGGKKVLDRTFPVMFLYTNEFAWIPNTDLTPLNPEECKDVAEKGKSKTLLAAYEVAAENHDVQYFKNMLVDHARALQEEVDFREAKQAEKAAKADKKKRKSETKVEQDDVEMEDADGPTEPKKSSKKRKKDAENDDEETEKPAKTPKTTKLKLTTNKTPTTTEKKPKEKAPKPKSEKKTKPKPSPSDEEGPEAQEEEPEKPVDPVEARKAREKEVLFLRHKLQKGFLSREQAPQEEEMPQMSNFIKKLENYGELEVSIIRATKINKVLKALIKLNTIPRDEEFEFRKRSVDLLGKWNKILGADPTEGENTVSGDKESKDTPTTNGIHEAKPDETTETGASVEKPTPDAETGSKAAANESTGNNKTESAKSEEPKISSGVATASKSEPSHDESASVEKAPESAEAATEAQEIVKASE